MSTLEFDVSDFLEYFDESLLSCIDDTLKKRDRDNLYNQLRNEIDKFVLSIKEYDIKSQFIEVNEIEFMLNVFEIIDTTNTKGLIDLEKFLEHMKKFSKRYRNISKTLDDINTKIMKQDMKISEFVDKENCNFSFFHSLGDFTVFFGAIGLIFYFINSMGLNQVECETIFGYGNETLSCNLD